MKKELSEAVESKRERRKRAVALSTYEVKRSVGQALFGRFRKKTILSAKANELIFIWVMLAIPIVNFLIFWLYVNFNSILLAFKNIDFGGTGDEYWTLNNFKNIFEMFKSSDTTGGLVRYGLNTLKFWALSTFWSIPHSILLTYVFQKKVVGHKFFRVMLYLPSIICAVVMAGIFESFIAQDGAVGYIASHFFGVEEWPLWFSQSEYATNALLFYSFFFSFAGHYVIFSGAMARIPTEITEAALMDGVTMWKELWYVDIPLMWPTISMQIVIQFSGIFGASGAILLLTPNLNSTWTMGYWIFDQVRMSNSYYLPAALGLMFTLIAFPLGLLVRKLVTSVYQDVT